MPFELSELSIPDIILVKPQRFEDERGYFKENYKKSSFQEAGITADFVQDNLSHSQKNVLRGLHFQNPPFAQAKLVQCLKGEIFDVAVDIRKGSSNYGEWIGEYLDSNQGYLLYIPEGFAHGFFVTEESALVVYKVTSEYSPEHESGIIWNDPEIGIEWPTENEPILSEKDSELPKLEQTKNEFD